MHIHRAASETFVVLDGELRVVVDGQEHRAGAGCAAVLPWCREGTPLLVSA